VHQVGFYYTDISRCTVNNTQNLLRNLTIFNFSNCC